MDPMRSVDIAVITHAHSDHARAGSRVYYCVESGAELLRRRIGEKAEIRTFRYAEKFPLGNAQLSFHPAGHILGSSQVRIETDQEVCVCSGDYKREADASCEPFEVVPCDTFITESTFAHPAYRWENTQSAFPEILSWWNENSRAGRNSLLYCYALGKTQRVLAELAKLADSEGRRVLLFGEAAELTAVYRAQGVPMIQTERLEDVGAFAPLRGELIVAPHGIGRSPWLEKLDDPDTAFASGWMGSNQKWMRGRYDRGFVISDHADWDGLVRTATETGAKRVRVLGARDEILVKHLRGLGIEASLLLKEGAPPPVKTAARTSSDPKRKNSTTPVQGDLFRPWSN